jgi:hypothetical protein
MHQKRIGQDNRADVEQSSEESVWNCEIGLCRGGKIHKASKRDKEQYSEQKESD